MSDEWAGEGEGEASSGHEQQPPTQHASSFTIHHFFLEKIPLNDDGAASHKR
jgi:hypothetical protein